VELRDAPPGNAPSLDAIVYADETARLADSGFDANDVGKIALQLSPRQRYWLDGVDPIVWTPVSGGAQGPPGDVSGAWPVGSIFLSVVSTNPGILLGVGTWVAFATGRMLFGIDPGQSEFDTVEETGGSKTVTPAGTVSQPTFTGSALSAHSHGVGTYAAASASAGTPSGTCSAPTFTGSALATHAHELPIQLVSGTSGRHLASTVFGTGTSRAAQGQWTKTANTTSAAVALSEAKSAGTPAGTCSTPTFTGSALGGHGHSCSGSSESVTAGIPSGTVSQPAFSGAEQINLPPYVVVHMWKRTA